MGEVVGGGEVEARNVSVNEIRDAGKQRQKICTGKSAGLIRLATDRKQSQTKANAQSDDDNLASAVTRVDHDILFLDILVNKVCHCQQRIC